MPAQNDNKFLRMIKYSNLLHIKIAYTILVALTDLFPVLNISFLTELHEDHKKDSDTMLQEKKRERERVKDTRSWVSYNNERSKYYTYIILLMELEASQDVVVDRVSQMIQKVLVRPNACHKALYKVTQDGQHGQPSILNLLELQVIQ
jgi:hypothetical protein